MHKLKYGNKRCRNFDDSGNPIRNGCRKGSDCRFFHPEDPGWRDGVSTCFTQQPYRSNTDPYSPKVYRSRRDWQGSRRSSPSRSRSRSPRYRRQTKRDSISSSVASEPGPSRAVDDSQFPVPPSPLKATPADSHPSGSSERSTGAGTSADQSVALPTPPTTGNDSSRSFASRLATTPTTTSSFRPSQTRVVQTATLTASPTCMSPSDLPIMPPTEPKAFRTATGVTNKSSTAPRASAPRASASTAYRSPVEMNPTPAPPPDLPPPPPPPPPPQPTQPAPMQPPHPLPEIPSGLAAGSASPAVDIDIKSQEQLWKARTRAASNYLLAYDKATAAEQELSDALKMTQTTGYQSLSEPEKTKHKEEYEKLVAKVEDAKKERDAARLEIINVEVWPGLPPDLISDSNVEEEMIEKQAEILTFVKELHGMASQMVRLLGDIAVPPPEPLFLEDEDENQGDEEEQEGAGSGMDVDQPEGSSVPSASQKKKRRDKGKGKAKAEPNPLQDSATAQNSEQVRKLTDRLVVYEDKISTMFNYLTIYDNEKQEQFKELIEERVEQVREANRERTRAWNQKQVEKEQAVNIAVQQVQDVAKRTNDEVGQLAEEIARMMQDADRLEQEIEKEKLERAQALQRLSSVEKRVEEYMSVQQSYEETIATLRTSINAHINRPPSPPSSPMIPSTDVILSTIERNVNDSLRESMIPMIQEFREEMERVIERRGIETYGTMWRTVNPTMEVLKEISAKMSTSTPAAGAGMGAASQSSEMSVDPVPVQNRS